ncbi:MAG: DUF1329 domain-containing protein [Nevskia sp.]|nr:DUF1329 domain-containing protein [Nevskia sp.]
MTSNRSLLFALALCAAGPVGAAVTPAEAARLGHELTAVGATATANADSSIPAWTGGQPAQARGDGFPHDVGIDSDRPLFVITPGNVKRYAAHLTEGHLQLFARYQDYRMVVYPTRRTASLPEKVVDGTVLNATQCELSDADQPVHCGLGVPFPIPHSGAEAMWNHKLRWRGAEVQRYDNQFMVSYDGSWQQNRVVEQLKYSYAPDGTASGRYTLVRYLAHTLAPARIADSFLLVQEHTGSSEDGRSAWVVRSNLKRVRRAPTLEYDMPYPDTDGALYYDQVDMFSGDLDRYDWTLVGKQELYVPYNDNHLAGRAVRYRNLLRPGHLNQELPRYELHRCWIVDAVLKPGAHHVYARRRYYLDEDSWNIVAVDNHDATGSLRGFQEGHLVHFATPQVTTAAPQVIYDFSRGGYFVSGAFNEDKAPDFDAQWSDAYFDAASLSRLATR